MLKTGTQIIKNNKFEIGALVLIGGYKAFSDYRNVKEEYKKRIVLNDSVIIASTVGGMLGYKGLIKNKTIFDKVLMPMTNFFDKNFNKLLNTTFIKEKFMPIIRKIEKPLEKPTKYSKELIGECLSNMALFASGLLGGIGGDFILSKFGYGVHNVKSKRADEVHQNAVQEFINKSSEKTKISSKTYNQVMSDITYLPVFDTTTATLVGLEALKITDEKSIRKQFEKASKYVMVTSLIPIFFVSLSNILTRNLKNLYRYPIMLLSVIGGSAIVNKAIKNSKS